MKTIESPSIKYGPQERFISFIMHRAELMLALNYTAASTSMSAVYLSIFDLDVIVH